MDRKPLTVFEFNGFVLKVCRSQRRGRGRFLTHCFYFDIAGEEDGAVVELLRRALEKNRCEARNAVLSLPRYAALSLFFRLPSREPRELSDMVRLRLAREAGQRGRGDFLHAFAVAGFDAEGCALVSVCLFPKEKFLRYLLILERADVHPSAVTINAAGIFGLLRDGARGGGSAGGEEALMFLHADGDVVDFYAVVNGMPVMSRTLGPVGAPARGGAGLARELKLSAEAARRMTGMAPSFRQTCYVMGAEKATRDILSDEALPYAPQGMKIFDRLAQRCAGVVSFKDAGVSLVSVAALALGYGRGIFDMTPDEVRARRAQNRMKRLRFFLLVRMAAASVVLALFFARYTQQRMEALREWSKELVALAPIERALREAEFFDTLKKKWRGHETVAALLSDLRAALESGVYLGALEWKEGGALKLEGRAETASGLLRSYAALHRLPRLERLRLEYSRETSGAGVSFRIQGVFR